MITTLVALLMLAAALGGGSVILRLVRVGDCLSPAERLAWGFILGAGTLGWTAYALALVGWAKAGAFLGLCLLMSCGLVWAARPRLIRPAGRLGWILAGLALFVAVVDVMEALSPMADADTLTYHYALIKQVLSEGRMVFQPRAVDGATPLLIQMSYGVAMALGGEGAANLWLMFTGWCLGLLAATVAARHVSPLWAAAIGLLVQTLPAVVIGGGTGQIEIRMALFATVAMVAVADLWRTGRFGFAVIAGLAGGFVVGAKLTGLVFGGSLGLGMAVILLTASRPGWLAAAALTALLAACPHYVWSWLQTGDPMFPMLWGKLEYLPGTPWNAEQNRYMYDVLAQSELAVPKSLTWLLLYPFAATFTEQVAFDSFRAGFGPWVIMILPLALLGWPAERRSALGRQALVVLGVAGLFYVLWFMFGGSQRVRHYLPVLPAVLAVLTPLAVAWCTRHGAARVLATAMAAMLCIQGAAQAVMARNFAVYLFGGEDRATFIERNVGYSGLVAWSNANLGPGDRLLHQVRQINYLLDVPYLFAMSSFEARVEVRPDNTNAALFWRQLRREGITHITVHARADADLPAPLTTTSLPSLTLELLSTDCAAKAARIETLSSPGSRALSTLQRPAVSFLMIRLTPGPSCRYDRP